MLKDLHIHIERGEYSRQWIEKFINQAVKMNIGEINLLEHSVRIKEFHPTFKQASEYSLYQKRWFEGKRGQAHSLDEYKALIDEIRSIDYPVKVNFGLEVCWFEQHEDYIRNLLNECNFDYVCCRSWDKSEITYKIRYQIYYYSLLWCFCSFVNGNRHGFVFLGF